MLFVVFPPLGAAGARRADKLSAGVFGKTNMKKPSRSFGSDKRLKSGEERGGCPTNADAEQICYFLFLSFCSGFNRIHSNLQGNFHPREKKNSKRKGSKGKKEEILADVKRLTSIL